MLDKSIIEGTKHVIQFLLYCAFDLLEMGNYKKYRTHPIMVKGNTFSIQL